MSNRFISRSQDLFDRAQHSVPGGVNSPVRAFKSVGGTPPFIQQARGAELVDVDGHTYIDYVGSWGPMIAGHAHPQVLSAVRHAIEKGCSYGAPTEAEVVLAERIIDWVPSIEMVRLVNSGTEATMSALRLARAVTKRDAVVKFEGCYHGHADSFLVAAGSGAATFGTPSSPGVTKATASDTWTLAYNDLEAAEALFLDQGDQIAAVIVEPIAGNMGCVLPEPGFLEGLRELCSRYGALLIFDEVMTGFRVARGGAQAYFNIEPDLTTLGKIIGGGLPVGAYGGRRDLMEQISPSGPVYQAGTLSGNPLATAAGNATLEILSEPGFYETLEVRAEKLTSGLDEILSEAEIPHYIARVASMFGLFFTQPEHTAVTKITNFSEAAACNVPRFNRWFHAMLKAGVYLAPSPFEACFVSASHTETIIDTTLEAAKKAISEIQFKED